VCTDRERIRCGEIERATAAQGEAGRMDGIASSLFRDVNVALPQLTSMCHCRNSQSSALGEFLKRSSSTNRIIAIVRIDCAVFVVISAL
jgi:hypothetical protein